MITFATKEVSHSAVPLVHEVIPIIDSLTAHFNTVIDNKKLNTVVRAAALRGLIMLNKYYAKTDESVVYRIAMMLHPAYKLDYFAKAKWEVTWITEAKRVITEVWLRDYKPAVAAAAAAADSAEDSSKMSDVCLLSKCLFYVEYS